MMKGVVSLWIALLLAVLITVVIGKPDWGFEGHEITASISQRLLSASALRNVTYLLGGRDLIDVCTWADTVRYTTHPFSEPFHYTNPTHNPEIGYCSYNYGRDCANELCVVGAVFNYSEILTHSSYPLIELEEALKFLTHFASDIHNPLHVCGIYTGGNDYILSFYGVKTNLHKVWDTDIPERFLDLEFNGDQEKYIAYLLDKIATDYSGEVASWITCKRNPISTVCPDEWAEEAAMINCNSAWIGIEQGGNLGDPYYLPNSEVVNKQLAKAGVRLAAVLNEIYA
jgi:hypothetical protein